MTDKSYVTLETANCPVCGKNFETGALLMDRRLRKTFDHTTCTHWEMCPEHKKLADDGYIALVACDHAKSKAGPGGRMKPEDAYRTGQIAHIKKAAFDDIFSVPAPDGMIAFCDDELIEKLKGMMPQEGE